MLVRRALAVKVPAHVCGCASKTPIGGAGKSASSPLKAEVPVATTLFKLTNPELMVDPAKRSSWILCGGVVSFFAVYIAYLEYTEPPPPKTQPPPSENDVKQVLADGRLLMYDGSIQQSR